MGNWDAGDYMAVIFLFFYLGIPAFTIFMHRWFVMVDETKIKQTKARDVMKFFPLVKEWLSFPDSHLLSPNVYSVFDSRHQLLHAVSILNSPLPERYQISEDMSGADFKNFKILFQEYQKVISYEFFDSNYLFSANYTNYFSRKNRKLWHIESLAELWGGVVKENIFFAETWYDFLYNALDYPRLVDNKFYFYKDGELFLSDFGRTAYKAYLATLLVKEKLGYTYFRTVISDVKSMLEAAVE